jgi:hypothetical protein
MRKVLGYFFMLVLPIAVSLTACGSPPTQGTPTSEQSTLTPAPNADAQLTPVQTTGPTTPTPAPSPTSTLAGTQREPDGRHGAFVVLDNPRFVSADAAVYLHDDALVLGLDVEGEPRAYPVSMMYFHHIVNDLVNGRPITVTY